MRNKTLTASAAAAMCVLNSFAGFAANEIYRTDIEVRDADRTFSITDGDGEAGFRINADGGIVTVNGGEKCGVCQNNSRWYITYDKATRKFNVVLDGVSIYCGESEFNTENISVTNSDEYTVFKSGTLNYREMTVSSEKFNVSEKQITGIDKNTTAEYIIENLIINANATARVVTKNGLERSGKLHKGDYLECVDMLGNIKKFTFPQIDIGGIRSDFFGLDFETMTVINLPMGLTAEQIKGAINSDIDFNTELTADGLKIIVGNNEYKFSKVTIPPQTAGIYYTDCENDDFLNWEASAANVSSVFTDEKHKKSFEISPELSSYNATVRKMIENDGEVFALSNDIKYIFENPQDHTRQFNAPIITSKSGDSLYVRERRGEIVYSDIQNDEEFDNYLNIYSNNDEWHNVSMIVNPVGKNYSVYYDGVKKADAKMKNSFDYAKYLTYTLNRIERDENGKLYVDNIAVFKPFANLGVIEYKNGNECSYSSEKLSKITAADLIFSTADYSKINPTETAKTISVTKNGENVDFDIVSEENKLSLAFKKPLTDGEYEIIITKPHTIYGVDSGVYKYSFSVGKKINHIDAILSGNKIKTEAELSDNALFSGKCAIAAVYDENMKMCAANSVTIDNENGNVYIECDIDEKDKPYYVKIFVWEDFRDIQPVCEGFVKSL